LVRSAVLAALLAFYAILARPAAATVDGPIALSVDASTVTRGIVHVRETIPVHPGPLTLYFPKWIPGDHSPAGRIENLVALRVAAGSTTLAWRRDGVDMFAFHVDVPAGTTSLDLGFDAIRFGDRGERLGTSDKVAVIEWNTVVLYPAGTPVADITVRAGITLPQGWDFGTALIVDHRDGAHVEFAPTSLEMLVDSTLDAGLFARKVPLVAGNGWTTELDLFADSAHALAASDATITKFKRLVREELAVYGARHWRNYHFLLTLSNVIGFHGLEHHEESDNGASENYVIDEDALATGADLLPHEFNHSWDGKYRRPADLATPDYQQPEQTDLLWVYEGMTQYYGEVFAYRSGLQQEKYGPDMYALIAASLDTEPGRLSRPLLDTAVSAPFLYTASGAYSSLRRGVDFYSEGVLVWLDADTLIRAGTSGRRSLDDFARAFFGGGHDTPPMVVTYTRADIIAGLNAVYPYDWARFFHERIDDVQRHPPLDALERSGWRLVYRDEPNALEKMTDGRQNRIQARYTLGIGLDTSGSISDVLIGSPAAQAGLAPGMRIVAVDGRTFSRDVFEQAILGAKGSITPIELLIENAGYYRTYQVDYHGGPRYPALERIPGRRDLLAEILRPRTSTR
jgi:predicted metalloprotease with PDZ domain